MPELDAFEIRLQAALVRETAAAPATFDALAFARTVALREPRRRGFRVPRRAFGVTIPRLAWVLLWLAVLTTLIAGMLTVGSSLLHRLAAEPPSPPPLLACPAGSTPDRPGAVDQARPPVSFAAPMAFDRRAGRIVVLARGQDEASVETWTFDVCTNTWTRMHPNRAPGAPLQLVYDPASDRTITLADLHVWVYDLSVDSWTERGLVPVALRRQVRLVADPVAGVILAQASTTEIELEPAELWTYDVGTDTWSRARQRDAPTIASAHEGLLAYDASADQLVGYEPPGLGGTAKTRLYDIRSGAWSLGPPAPELNLGMGPSGGEIAYDEARQRIVVFSNARVVAYDARAAGWTTIAGDPRVEFPMGVTARIGHWTVYDPLNARLVVYGGQARMADPGTETGSRWEQPDDVLAFDPATGRWIVLLEGTAADAQPS